MRILISSHYSLLHSIDAAEPQLVDLNALIARWHPERIRRIDRYIQLCRSFLARRYRCLPEYQLRRYQHALGHHAAYPAAG